ncbi:RNA polymerase sigma-70 factor [Chitinophaga qingshengii]|uniref:RNA polymerase sigma-70 factor n=1 Tax=Chitinophaga qingshengii TaxID=1569794 RepID=A0ABR7TJT8_9BACT|nr:RNA polymerase sigma-70 factor [Chitinophaga qingshengii]MBC9929788.1 RNA polymerase sigma-70 factor [Chitinophaga qingshengii]
MAIEKGELPGEGLLVERLRQGDEKAFRALYDFYWEKQYDLACYKLGVKALAEEITQEVFVALWLQREELDPAKPIGAWLYGVTQNRILNTYRKQLSHHKYLQQVPVQEITHNTTEQLSFNELNTVVQQRIAELPDKCREVFTMSRIQGFNTQQIAEMLNISPKTVNNHLVKALRIMRVNLKDYIALLILLSLRR